MKIIRTQHLNSMSVYQMCRRENLYTRGTEEQYNHMLMDMIPVEGIYNPTDMDIYNIAVDIAKHSHNSDSSELEFIENIMYLIGQCITMTFEIIEE